MEAIIRSVSEGLFVRDGSPAPLPRSLKGVLAAAEATPWPARLLIFLLLANVALRLKIGLLGGASPWPAYVYEYALVSGTMFAGLALLLRVREDGLLPQVDDRFWSAAVVAGLAAFAVFQALWLGAASAL